MWLLLNTTHTHTHTHQGLKKWLPARQVQVYFLAGLVQIGNHLPLRANMSVRMPDEQAN